MRRRFFRGARGLRFWQKFTRRKVRVRSGGSQAREAHIDFESAGAIDTAEPIGNAVGTFSVAHSDDAFTFSLTDDADGLFAIDGADLEVADTLTAGEHSVTVEADDGDGTVLTASYTITVAAV